MIQSMTVAKKIAETLDVSVDWLGTRTEVIPEAILVYDHNTIWEFDKMGNMFNIRYDKPADIAGPDFDWESLDR